MMSRRIVHTESAPAAVGPYSQGIVTGNLIFTAGQIPLDPATGQLIDGDFTDRVRRVLDNIEAILNESGTSLAHAVKLTVFLTDLGKFAELNTVFNDRFDGIEPPARSAVQVSALPLGTDVEIECIAEVVV